MMIRNNNRDGRLWNFKFTVPRVHAILTSGKIEGKQSFMKKQRNKPVNHKLEKALEYVYAFVGSGIVAIGFNQFLLPNQIAAGGVSGISTILDSVLGWEPAFVQWAFNIPLFVLGVILLGGRQYGVKTLIGTLFLPFVVYLTRNPDPWTQEPLLGALFGGVCVGLGLGIVFRGRGSTGGTDLVAQIINKYTGFSLGACVALIDGLIVLAATVAFDIEAGLYALIGLYVTSKTIDLVQVGFGSSKMALVITSRQEEVREAILTKIDRGMTKLSAYGGYTDEERPVLMCVVEQQEFTKLKQTVRSIDPDAFIIVTDASEVLGEGFKRN